MPRGNGTGSVWLNRFWNCKKGLWCGHGFGRGRGFRYGLGFLMRYNPAFQDAVSLESVASLNECALQLQSKIEGLKKQITEFERK